MEERSWKLFCWLLFLLLHRAESKFSVTVEEFCRRFDLLGAGTWDTFVDEAVASFPRARPTARRLWNIEDGDKAACQKAQLGEISRACQCLTGAGLAPGNDETFNDLQKKKSDFKRFSWSCQRTSALSCQKRPWCTTEMPSWRASTHPFVVHLQVHGSALTNTWRCCWMTASLSSCCSTDRQRGRGKMGESGALQPGALFAGSSQGRWQSNFWRSSRRNVRHSSTLSWPGWHRLRRAFALSGHGCKSSRHGLGRWRDWSLRRRVTRCNIEQTPADVGGEGPDPIRDAVQLQTLCVRLVRWHRASEDSDCFRKRVSFSIGIQGALEEVSRSMEDGEFFGRVLGRRPPPVRTLQGEAFVRPSGRSIDAARRARRHSTAPRENTSLEPKWRPSWWRQHVDRRGVAVGRDQSGTPLAAASSWRSRWRNSWQRNNASGKQSHTCQTCTVHGRFCPAHYAQGHDEGMWNKARTLLGEVLGIEEVVRETERVARLPVWHLGQRSGPMRTRCVLGLLGWCASMISERMHTVANLVVRTVDGGPSDTRCLAQLEGLLIAWTNRGSAGAQVGQRCAKGNDFQRTRQGDRASGQTIMGISPFRILLSKVRSHCCSLGPLRSHSGWNAGTAVATAPTAPECTIQAAFIPRVDPRRLQLPLTINEIACEGCHASLDAHGRHRVGCPRSGRLMKRAETIERVHEHERGCWHASWTSHWESPWLVQVKRKQEQQTLTVSLTPSSKGHRDDSPSVDRRTLQIGGRGHRVWRTLEWGGSRAYATVLHVQSQGSANAHDKILFFFDVTTQMDSNIVLPIPLELNPIRLQYRNRSIPDWFNFRARGRPFITCQLWFIIVIGHFFCYFFNEIKRKKRWWYSQIDEKFLFAKVNVLQNINPRCHFIYHEIDEH